MVYYHPGFVATENTELPLRRNLMKVSQRLVDFGLNRGTSGNCSIRAGSGFLITPSGLSAGELSPDNMVQMDFSGLVVGQGKPSSEWRFHLDILDSRKEINAVIHTHSTYATTLACLSRDIPAFHYMIAIAGGESIRCAPYRLFGSQELSDVALLALEGRRACLLANHGMIAIGRSLEEALDIAVEVETLSEQYIKALQVGEPVILSQDEMVQVMEQFKGYGRWSE